MTKNGNRPTHLRLVRDTNDHTNVVPHPHLIAALPNVHRLFAPYNPEPADHIDVTCRPGAWSRASGLDSMRSALVARRHVADVAVKVATNGSLVRKDDGGAIALQATSGFSYKLALKPRAGAALKPRTEAHLTKPTRASIRRET